MAIKAKDVYRGRKKRGVNGWLIAAIVLALILLAIGAFYMLRHFTVYDSEGNATIVFPWTDEESVPPEAKKYDEARTETVESHLDEIRAGIAAETAEAQAETEDEANSSAEATEETSQDSSESAELDDSGMSDSTNSDEENSSQQENTSSDTDVEIENTEENTADNG